MKSDQYKNYGTEVSFTPRQCDHMQSWGRWSDHFPDNWKDNGATLRMSYQDVQDLIFVADDFAQYASGEEKNVYVSIGRKGMGIFTKFREKYHSLSEHQHTVLQAIADCGGIKVPDITEESIYGGRRGTLAVNGLVRKEYLNTDGEQLTITLEGQKFIHWLASIAYEEPEPEWVE